MKNIYRVKVLETYCGLPATYHFKCLDSVEPCLRKIYPRKYIQLDETYFIEVISVTDDSIEYASCYDICFC